MKPNYKDLGFADQMGDELRSLVEEQLQEDLKHYGVYKKQLKFDWSDSCVEGQQTFYLDGSVENYSGIAVFDEDDNLVADGWMEFIHESDFFIAYWDDVTTWDGDNKLAEKKFGLPVHIWNQIPAGVNKKYKIEKLKEPRSTTTPKL